MAALVGGTLMSWSSPASPSSSSLAPRSSVGTSSSAVSSGAGAEVVGSSTGSSEDKSCWGTWEPGVLT